MVKFGEITSKTIRVDYTKTDLDGYIIKGNATYNKENKLTDANGNIENADKKNFGSFNIYGSGEDMRITLNASADKTDEVNEAAKATLADLAEGYTE
jgi:hypothetical protein